MSEPENAIQWGPKLKFFSGHLFISVAVFVSLLLLIWNVWYPQPFFWTDGGSDGLGTVAFVDIVIGPFLSLVIFNPAKSRRELRLDIGMVVLIQICAMMYGVFTVYKARPVVLVFSDGQFQTFGIRSFLDQSVSPGQFKQFGDELPPVVYSGSVQNKEEGRIFTENILAGITGEMQFHLYRNFYENLGEVLPLQLDLPSGFGNRPRLKAKSEKLVKKLGIPIDDLYFFPYIGRFRNGIMVLNSEGERIGFLYEDPGGIRKLNPEISAELIQPVNEKSVEEGQVPNSLDKSEQ